MMNNRVVASASEIQWMRGKIQELKEEVCELSWENDALRELQRKTEGGSPTNHYDGDACWNAIESAELAEPFALGCVIKYAWRYRHTRNTADLRKAIDYLERVIALNEKRGE